MVKTRDLRVASLNFEVVPTNKSIIRLATFLGKKINDNPINTLLKLSLSLLWENIVFVLNRKLDKGCFVKVWMYLSQIFRFVLFKVKNIIYCPFIISLIYIWTNLNPYWKVFLAFLCTFNWLIQICKEKLKMWPSFRLTEKH